MYEEFIQFIRDIYQTDEFIPLHEPRFSGNEKKYVADTIDSTFVSTVGEYVNRFEHDVAKFTGSKHAIATVNGTSALHVSLLLAGVEAGDEVITQSLSFVATCNAIAYCSAKPVFVDVDKSSLGLSADALSEFLHKNAERLDSGSCINKSTGSIIRACIPMHTFGLPVEMEKIIAICQQYGITVVEDAAESMGSYISKTHTGNFGTAAALSFNGNKIMTCGGGGMILTNDEDKAQKAKHLTTTGRLSHPWKIEHDCVAYNYRMPNLNAALGCAQLEQLPTMLKAKRELAETYQAWGNKNSLEFVSEVDNTTSNYWLNAVVCEDVVQRDKFLEVTNNHQVMTRPIWTPMHQLPMYENCQYDNLENTDWLVDRVVNVPSSIPLNSGGNHA